MRVVEDPAELRAWVQSLRGKGRRIGFVPTMGYLHEGHLRLVDHAAQQSDAVVVSIFVNPLQFGPNEDFARYPRDLARDIALAESRGVACLFVPSGKAVYPGEPQVRVTPGSLGDHLCGPWRPGHFEGVLTVVAKLFHMVQPDVAVFGRKDVQQARMIVRMVEDLDFPLTITVAPTTRESDGLALSSRNAYLDPGERRAAVQLSRALEAGHERYRDGTRDAQVVLAAIRGVLAAERLIRVQYVEAVDPRTLRPVSTISDDTVLALACFIGKTRLIDNVTAGSGLAADERVPAAAGVA